MNRLAWIPVLTLLAWPMAMAQEDEPPASIVTQPADRMKWSMMVEADPQPDKPPMTPTPANVPPQPIAWNAVSWDFTKVGKLTKVVVKYTNGTVRDYWRVGPMTLVENSLHPNRIYFQGPGLVLAYPKACDGFYGIPTVQPGDDQGKKSFKGAVYHYFRGTLKTVASPVPYGPALAPNPAYEAWFDLKTGLPKAFRNNGETLIFEFSPETPGELHLPPKFQAAWDAAARGA